MNENTLTVPVVYQGGVFIPEQDVSFLAEGARLALPVPPPPDEWDDLLDELVAHEAADKADDLPDALDWMGGRRIGMSSEDVSQVIDVERLLGWGFSPSLSSVLLL